MLQSVVGSSPFRGEDRGPRRPPVGKGRSFDSPVLCRQVGQPESFSTRASENRAATIGARVEASLIIKVATRG